MYKLDNGYVGSYVVLKDGKIWEWKSVLGRRFTIDGAKASARSAGNVHVGEFPTFDAAREWMRQWPIHPDQPGFLPYEVTP